MKHWSAESHKSQYDYIFYFIDTHYFYVALSFVVVALWSIVIDFFSLLWIDFAHTKNSEQPTRMQTPQITADYRLFLIPFRL